MAAFEPADFEQSNPPVANGQRQARSGSLNFCYDSDNGEIFCTISRKAAFQVETALATVTRSF